MSVPPLVSCFLWILPIALGCELSYVKCRRPPVYQSLCRGSYFPTFCSLKLTWPGMVLSVGLFPLSRGRSQQFSVSRKATSVRLGICYVCVRLCMRVSGERRGGKKEGRGHMCPNKRVEVRGQPLVRVLAFCFVCSKVCLLFTVYMAG